MSSNDAVQEIEKAVRLDIVLSEPSAPKPAALENVEYRSPPSAEEIQKKLDDAQKRRISLISEKQASLAAHMSKIEDIHQRKQQQDAEFIRATKEAIDQKLETAEEKRIQQLNDLKAKVLFFPLFVVCWIRMNVSLKIVVSIQPELLICFFPVPVPSPSFHIYSFLKKKSLLSSSFAGERRAGQDQQALGVEGKRRPSPSQVLDERYPREAGLCR
jgi:hypothetical protein